MTSPGPLVVPFSSTLKSARTSTFGPRTGCYRMSPTTATSVPPPRDSGTENMPARRVDSAARGRAECFPYRHEGAQQRGGAGHRGRDVHERDGVTGGPGLVGVVQQTAAAHPRAHTARGVEAARPRAGGQDAFGRAATSVGGSSYGQEDAWLVVEDGSLPHRAFES